MKSRNRAPDDEMRSEYELDYSTAVRGKYYRRLLREGASVVVLEPDVARAFRTSAAVNEALRVLLAVSESTRRLGLSPATRSRASRVAAAEKARRAARR